MITICSAYTLILDIYHDTLQTFTVHDHRYWCMWIHWYHVLPHLVPYVRPKVFLLLGQLRGMGDEVKRLTSEGDVNVHSLGHLLISTLHIMLVLTIEGGDIL